MGQQIVVIYMLIHHLRPVWEYEWSTHEDNQVTKFIRVITQNNGWHK